MSAGTLTLTNNSAAVTGSSTTFTTELAAGDFIVVTVGGVPYTLPVKSVEGNTSLTLVSNFTGPTQSGAAWSAIPRVAMNMVTAALVAQSAEALRGLNYDKQNWQSIFSSASDDVTITLPDLSKFSGPSWLRIKKLLEESDIEAIKPIAAQVSADAKQVAADKKTVVETASQVSTDAQTASTAATGAKGSATNASQSETNAEGYKELARKYALNPEDNPVTGSEYSALHYSEKARKFAEEAASHNPAEALVKSLNLSDLADRAAAWLNVRPTGSTPLAADPEDPTDATTKRWVENLVKTDGTIVTHIPGQGNSWNDWQTLLATQRTHFLTGDTDSPTGGGVFGFSTGHSNSATGNYGFQVCGRNTAMYFRTAESGVWQTWQKITTAAVSDEQLKHEIEDTDGTLSLENIKAMELKTFVYKDDDKRRVRRGVIAQQIRNIDPCYVKEVHNGDEVNLVLDSNPLLLDAISAVKVLARKVEELQAELKTLKGE